MISLLNAALLFLSTQVIAQKQPTNQDFLNLRDTLLKYIAEDPKEIVPPLMRISFHDLFNLDPATGTGGPRGCILQSPVAEMDENKGVSEAAVELMEHVVAAHPDIAFTSGDVLSFAGKIATEVAYPCLQIPWRWGRSSCTTNSSSLERELGPPGNITTRAAWQPFLDRFNLTIEEIGVLTAGAHGVATAAAKLESSGWGPLTLAWKNGGKDWISNTDTNTGPFWKHQVNENGKEQYERSDLGVGRLPSDMVFFPSTLAQIKNSTSNENVLFDSAMKDVETFLKSFVQQDRSVFDDRFGKVYAKMLDIGLPIASGNNTLNTLDEMGTRSGFIAGTSCAEAEEFPVALWYLAGWTAKGVGAFVGCIASALFGLGGLLYLS